MTFAENFAACMVKLETALGGNLFTWQGEDYLCSPGASRVQLTLIDGGFKNITALVLNVRREVFTDGVIPQAQQKVTYKEKDYRVQAVETDPTDTVVKLVCISPNALS